MFIQKLNLAKSQHKSKHKIALKIFDSDKILETCSKTHSLILVYTSISFEESYYKGIRHHDTVNTTINFEDYNFDGLELDDNNYINNDNNNTSNYTD